MNKEEKIVLSFPVRKENIMLARLVISGIAGNMRFDIESLEDMKVAVNEALLILLKQNYGQAELNFTLRDGGLDTEICGKDGACGTPLGADDMSVLLLEELVDGVTYFKNGALIECITLAKNMERG